jgi:hypothetical protein
LEDDLEGAQRDVLDWDSERWWGWDLLLLGDLVSGLCSFWSRIELLILMFRKEV